MAFLAKNNYLGKFLYLLCNSSYHQYVLATRAAATHQNITNNTVETRAGLDDQKRSSWTTSVFILAKKLSEKVLINLITVDNCISLRERVQSRGIKLQNWIGKKGDWASGPSQFVFYKSENFTFEKNIYFIASCRL